MEIVKIKLKELKPYKYNAKEHPKEQIEQIKNSILEFGNNDPIAVWGENNIIVEGHGRYTALQQLGYEEVECIRLDHLSDEERRAYTLAHNKLTMNTGWDMDVLAAELEQLQEIDFDLSLTGFDMDELGKLLEDEEDEHKEDKYTSKIDVPQYEITGECPSLDELVNEEKTDKFIKAIKISNISENEKAFLIKAATRHYVFNYAKIAEYYANANEEMQTLMEGSALVIIDYEDAIRNGYNNLYLDISEMCEEDSHEG